MLHVDALSPPVTWERCHSTWVADDVVGHDRPGDLEML